VENNCALRNLKAVFGEVPLTWMKPQHVYQYADRRRATPVAAHRAIDVLSHAFIKSVEWGFIDRHPFKGEVRRASEKPRDRYIEDWEVVECMALQSKRKKGSVLVLQTHIGLKLLTGLHCGNVLRLTSANLQEDEIHVKQGKTEHNSGRRIIYERSPELRQAVDVAKDVRPVDNAPSSSAPVEHLKKSSGQGAESKTIRAYVETMQRSHGDLFTRS